MENLYVSLDEAREEIKKGGMMLN